MKPISGYYLQTGIGYCAIFINIWLNKPN